MQVSVISSKIAHFLGGLPNRWVEGELTEWNPRGTLTYAKLSDLKTDAAISMHVLPNALSGTDTKFKAGDHVTCYLKAEIWKKRGELNFKTMAIKHVGEGELMERLLRLRGALSAEGLFDPSRKKPLPIIPNNVGLITGRNSDAEKDVLKIGRERWPEVAFRTIYAAVQGINVVADVMAALKVLDDDPDVDVIIITRGGGSAQDLLGFSDERLVRAVASAQTPIVVAIGHENDRPILDEVADVRASTPTHAAKLAVPDVEELRSEIRGKRERLLQQIRSLLEREEDRIAQTRTRPVFTSPESMIIQRAENVKHAQERAKNLVMSHISESIAAIGGLRAHLRGLSPQSTLDRGYAITQNVDGTIVRKPSDAPVGSQLKITLGNGALAATSQGSITV